VVKAFVSTLFPGIAHPDEGQIKNANDITHNFMRLEPGLVHGMAYLNPLNGNTQDELKRRIEDGGMSGIKLWIAVPCDHEAVNPIAEKAIEYDIPILIHAFYKAVEEIPGETRGFNVRNLAKRYPELKIIMAHLGGNVYDAIKCIKDCKNVYTDFSGTLFRRDDLDYTIKHIGSDRVLFGSDFPIAFEDCLGQVRGADISDEQRKDIFYRNAAKLFKLKNINSQEGF
jgi:hypothetical protein